MADMLALIASIEANGCPNCHSTDALIKHLRRGPKAPLVVRSVECGRCKIEWEANPIPEAELRTSTPLGHDLPGLF